MRTDYGKKKKVTALPLNSLVMYFVMKHCAVRNTRRAKLLIVSQRNLCEQEPFSNLS